MRTKYFIVIFGLMLFIKIPAHAQIDNRDEWMNKYWFYRYRLINDYMIVGEGEGKSIPAGMRNSAPLASCLYPNGAFGTWGVRANEKCDITWSDDGLMQLGWYIAVLASEYGCLKEFTLPNDASGHCMDQTSMELKYALEAVDRLDRTGENLQNKVKGWTTVADNQNGFIVRDDVPYDFIWDPSSTLAYLHPVGVANYYKINSQKTRSHDDPTKYSFVNIVKSDYQKAHDENDGGKLDPSKDQYIGLFMGLAMVCKFCDDADHTGDYYFKFEAQQLMQNILYFFMYQPDFAYSMIKHPYLDNYGYGGTTLESVGGGALGDDDGPGFYCVAKKAGITPDFEPPSNSRDHWLDDLDWTNILLFGGADKNDRTVLFNYMGAILAACGNGWTTEPFPDYTTYNVEANSSYNTQILDEEASQWDYQIMPLIHSVMFNAQSTKYKMADYAFFLNAPCYGPHNFGPQNFLKIYNIDDVPSNYIADDNFINLEDGQFYFFQNGYDDYEWSSPNRWVSQDRRGNLDFTFSGGFHNYEFKGEFNGLDYMLFYNLYLYNYGSSNGGSEVPQTGFKNELTNYLYNYYPYYATGNAIGGTYTQKKNIGFKSIVSTEHITSSGNVWDQAGEEINLTNGFHVDAGGLFTASVSSLTDCIDNGNTYTAPAPIKKKIIMPLPFIAQNSVLKVSPYMRKDSIVNTDISNLKLLNVFPNPFNKEINVAIGTADIGKYQLTIINDLGVVVKQQSVYNSEGRKNMLILLKPNELRPGAYTIIVSNDKNFSQKRILKY